jgi:predicted AAA+ superfamily ATPase
MIGQLQDAGNTTTLAHYLNLLDSAGMLTGLEKFSGKKVKRRASSPKLLILNTALMTAASPYTLEEARLDTEYWGHLVESVIGASLVNGLRGSKVKVFYWSSRNREVDFVLQRGKVLVAIEVKSGRGRAGSQGFEAFSKEYSVDRKILVGSQGIPVEEFLLKHPSTWIERQ